MVCLYGVPVWCAYIWCAYMWCACMVCLYGVPIWCAYMVCLYMVCLYVVCLYAVPLWCAYMLCLYGVPTWCAYMVLANPSHDRLQATYLFIEKTMHTGVNTISLNWQAEFDHGCYIKNMKGVHVSSYKRGQATQLREIIDCTFGFRPRTFFLKGTYVLS